MTLNNCRLCGSIYKVERNTPELCTECMIMHEAQYKVTLHRLTQRSGEMSFRDVALKLGYEPQRVQVYLANRFGVDTQFVVLDGKRKGYCYICNIKMYYPLESACLDCLQRILAVMENRDIAVPRTSQIRKAKMLKKLHLVHVSPPEDEAPEASGAWDDPQRTHTGASPP